MEMTDDALIAILSRRFAQSRKAFSDLSVVNRKLLEMNEKLEKSETLKSNFLSNIRNEINNPLNSIMGLSRQLAMLGAENEQIAALAAMIGSEATTLDFQLRNIFMAAELEAGEITPHCSRINLSSLLSEVISSFQSTASKKYVQLQINDNVLHDDCNETIIDCEYLQVILSNILANAIEYSHPGGTVEVSARLEDDGNIHVSVRDHGIGIAPEDQQRIFDRFVQLESGTTRSHLGHGLGLSITKALVDLMRGSIQVQSSSETGTLFSVILPPCSSCNETELFTEAGNLFIFDDMSEAESK